MTFPADFCLYRPVSKGELAQNSQQWGHPRLV
jgi:hypothetical protein